MEMYELKTCCCCISLEEGILFVSISGLAVSSSLLTLELVDLFHCLNGYGCVADITKAVSIITIFIYVLGVITNVSLGYGVWKKKRKYILSWLVLHIVIILALLCLSLYNIVLYTNTDCPSNIEDYFECPHFLVNASVIMGICILLVYYWYHVEEVHQMPKKSALPPPVQVEEPPPQDISDV